MAVWVFRSGRRGAISTQHTPRFSHRRRLSRTPLRGFTQPGAKPTRSAQPRKMARVFAASSTVHCSARPSSSSPVTPRRARVGRPRPAGSARSRRRGHCRRTGPNRQSGRAGESDRTVNARRRDPCRPLDRHRARIARRCWGSGTLNREGRGIAGAESGRYSSGCGGSGPPGESLVVTGRLLLQPSRVGMSIPLPIMTPVASQADQRVTFTTRAFC